MLGEEELEGVDCRLIEGVRASGESCRIWIDRERYLVRKLAVQREFNAEMQAEQMRVAREHMEKLPKDDPRRVTFEESMRGRRAAGTEPSEQSR